MKFFSPLSFDILVLDNKLFCFEMYKKWHVLHFILTIV